jgi:2-polyprenyl-3-methyl-5-hydroxy-6-metoxy-1,4-benzoquinol methylase
VQQMGLWKVPPRAFEGLAERCAPGVPEDAVALLAKHNVRDVPVLDLASGSGAFLARLRKSGFEDLTAVELDREKFGFRELTPHVVNLNERFSAAFDRQFGLITATEIIEHLDNPRHFLREIHALLRPDGHLLVSTPNVTNFEGRLKFLLQGELRYFDEAQYWYNHHISPITDTQMRLLLAEVGFQILAAKQSGSFSGLLRRWLFPGGEVNVYLARKCAPKPSVPTDWSR